MTITMKLRRLLPVLLVLCVVTREAHVQGVYPPSFSPGAAGALPTQITSGSSLLALEYQNAAGTPVKVEIFPSSSAKPDEGNASIAGTTAWAVAQLTSGGEILVHEGAYTVGTTITMSTANTSLVCTDNQAAIFTAASGFNSTMFKVGWAGAQRQGLAVRNCGFAGSSGNNSSGTLVWARDTAYVDIHGNQFADAALNGVIVDATVSGAVYNRVIDNNFAECREECLVLNGKGGASNATDSMIRGNAIGGSVTGDGTTPWVTIAGLGSLQFLQNHLSGPTHLDCMDFTDASQTDITIVGNEIENCPHNGIELAGANATISANLFYNVGTAATGTYEDIYLQNSTNNTITENSFRGQSTTRYGLFSDDGTQYNYVGGNVFTGLTGNAIQWANPYASANVVGPNVYDSVGGIYSQAGAHYGVSTVPLSAPAALSGSPTPGELNVNSIQLTQLGTGTTPVITTGGTAGAATWTYVVVPKDINGNAAPAGSAASTTTGNATLSGTNYNLITWTQVNGAYSYDIYRTAHGTGPTTTGLIGNVLASAQTLTTFTENTLKDTGLTGNGATAPTVNQTGSIGAAIINTTTNCSSGASPAVCGSAASGGAAVPTGTNPALVVDTTAVTANSQIQLTPDESLGTKLSVTCNTTITTLGPLVITARTPGVSFTVEVDATVGTNPDCFSWTIIN